MKKIVIVSFFAILLAGCNTIGPFGETQNILKEEYIKPSPQKIQTKVTVIRSDQVAHSQCPIRFVINGNEVAYLPANKYITVYLDNGSYLFQVFSGCLLTGRKSWDVFANGVEQEYFIEHGYWGQLRAIQNK